MLDRYDKEIRAVKSELFKFCWYMRGGLSYDEAIMLSQSDRDILNEIIKENLETTKKTGLPFF